MTNPGTADPAPGARVPRTREAGGAQVPGPAASTSPTRPGPVRRRPPHLTRAWWNTPRLVRALTALVLTAVPAFAATTATVLTGARDGPDTIGHRSGPQAVRATDLSFALDDMDARAANLLLLGADPDHATLRRQTLETYEQRRAYDSVSRSPGPAPSPTT